MSRIARVVIPGVPHHVMRQSNRGEKAFRRKADWQRYLELLAQYAPMHGLAIQAYCLMADHVHLVAVPKTAASLAGALKPVNLRYSQELNRRLGVSGLLWQGRFSSCPLDDEHLWAAIRFVERNPVRAGLVQRARDYEWSSAAAHCGLREDPLLAELKPPAWLTSWARWLRGREDEEMVRRLRLRTRTGRPAGSESFVKRLERRTGRRLHVLPIGRPPKKRRRAGSG